MDIALWIAAGVLAAVCLTGAGKMFVPKDKLAGMGGEATKWVEDFSPASLKAIGAIELLAAIGLILPAALDIAPVMVPVAATGLVLLFIGALTMRLRRGERVTVTGDLIWLGIAIFVAWGRFGPAAFPA
ncbi:DoxX family protein [Saccharomonospora sp. NPDC006951]